MAKFYPVGERLVGGQENVTKIVAKFAKML